jgi:hypothetical protein
MSVETKTKEATPSCESGSNVPSGFILKLFQMVNGAPDEVISVGTLIYSSFEIQDRLIHWRMEIGSYDAFFRGTA